MYDPDPSTRLFAAVSPLESEGGRASSARPKAQGGRSEAESEGGVRPQVGQLPEKTKILWPSSFF